MEILSPVGTVSPKKERVRERKRKRGRMREGWKHGYTNEVVPKGVGRKGDGALVDFPFSYSI